MNFNVFLKTIGLRVADRENEYTVTSFDLEKETAGLTNNRTGEKLEKSINDLKISDYGLGRMHTVLKSPKFDSSKYNSSQKQFLAFITSDSFKMTKIVFDLLKNYKTVSFDLGFTPFNSVALFPYSDSSGDYELTGEDINGDFSVIFDTTSKLFGKIEGEYCIQLEVNRRLAMVKDFTPVVYMDVSRYKMLD